MPLFALITKLSRTHRFLIFCATFLLINAFALAQVVLKFRLLNGYFLSDDAPVNKGKPTLFVFERAETFGPVFQAATVQGKRPDQPNFAKEMVIGVALPPTNTPAKVLISKVFVQDCTLTVRYISMTDTALIARPQSFVSRPILLLAIPKQTVLKSRLVENGKVVQTIKRREREIDE